MMRSCVDIFNTRPISGHEPRMALKRKANVIGQLGKRAATVAAAAALTAGLTVSLAPTAQAADQWGDRLWGSGRQRRGISAPTREERGRTRKRRHSTTSLTAGVFRHELLWLTIAAQ
jgi:hypothetical protein